MNTTQGTITVGGKITADQYRQLVELIDFLLVTEDYEGRHTNEWSFTDAFASDIDKIAKFCTDIGLVLEVFHEANTGTDSAIVFYTGDKRRDFTANMDGEIVISLEYLMRNRGIKVSTLISILDIPVRPPLDIT